MNASAFFSKLRGQASVTTREAAHLTGLDIPAASMALRRLAKEGLVIPVKRGHWLTDVSAVKPGNLLVAAADPYQAYLSGWSALRVHNRIQQIPEAHFAITLGRPREVEIGSTRISLHHIAPELFGGYSHEMKVEGFVASPEKAIFDLSYLAAMNRSRVGGNLPETDLRRIKWGDVKKWVALVKKPSLRRAVASRLELIRTRNEECEVAA